MSEGEALSDEQLMLRGVEASRVICSQVSGDLEQTTNFGKIDRLDRAARLVEAYREIYQKVLEVHPLAEKHSKRGLFGNALYGIDVGLSELSEIFALLGSSSDLNQDYVDENIGFVRKSVMSFCEEILFENDHLDRVSTRDRTLVRDFVEFDATDPALDLSSSEEGSWLTGDDSGLTGSWRNDDLVGEVERPLNHGLIGNFARNLEGSPVMQEVYLRFLKEVSAIAEDIGGLDLMSTRHKLEVFISRLR